MTKKKPYYSTLYEYIRSICACMHTARKRTPERNHSNNKKGKRENESIESILRLLTSNNYYCYYCTIVFSCISIVLSQYFYIACVSNKVTKQKKDHRCLCLFPVLFRTTIQPENSHVVLIKTIPDITTDESIYKT